MQSKRPPGYGGRCNGSVVREITHALNTPIAAPPQGFSQVRLRHLTERIHALGARALAELLAEHLQQGGDLAARLERYAAISPTALAMTGGDRFPPRFAPIEGGRQ